MNQKHTFDTFLATSVRHTHSEVESVFEAVSAGSGHWYAQRYDAGMINVPTATTGAAGSFTVGSV